MKGEVGAVVHDVLVTGAAGRTAATGADPDTDWVTVGAPPPTVDEPEPPGDVISRSTTVVW